MHSAIRSIVDVSGNRIDPNVLLEIYAMNFSTEFNTFIDSTDSMPFHIHLKVQVVNTIKRFRLELCALERGTLQLGPLKMTWCIIMITESNQNRLN